METVKAAAANSITVGRMLLSLVLFALSPFSILFAVLYLLCGLSDVLDGFAARKLHTESEKGERLDSIADLFFAAVYAVKILPILCLPAWIRIWVACIAVWKLFGIVKRSLKKRKFRIEHSAVNKVTGLLIFLLPLTVPLIDVRYCAAAICAAATFSEAEASFSGK